MNKRMHLIMQHVFFQIFYKKGNKKYDGAFCVLFWIPKRYLEQNYSFIQP